MASGTKTDNYTRQFYLSRDYWRQITGITSCVTNWVTMTLNMMIPMNKLLWVLFSQPAAPILFSGTVFLNLPFARFVPGDPIPYVSKWPLSLITGINFKLTRF
jgi:hypothetical protein